MQALAANIIAARPTKRFVTEVTVVAVGRVVMLVTATVTVGVNKQHRVWHRKTSIDSKDSSDSSLVMLTVGISMRPGPAYTFVIEVTVVTGATVVTVVTVVT